MFILFINIFCELIIIIIKTNAIFKTTNAILILKFNMSYKNNFIDLLVDSMLTY